MSNYHIQLDMLVRSANTYNALDAGLKQLYKQYCAYEKPIKIYPNGIKLMGIYDKEGNLLNQYHC